jgi:two-component system chemotaxis response regulator CheB
MAVDPNRLVALVGSTGGPEAIGGILKSFPKSFPCGIVIVIHLAHGFTEGFVQWLQGLSQIHVKVGIHGDAILPGVAYVAPTGSHMRVTKEQTLELGDEPPRSGLKPCGDYLLESVAKHYKSGAIGVILTGMGKDGAIGIQQIKACGGATIAQNEKTSAIFGMPRVAIETGAVDRVLSLDSIPGEITELLKG